jgi:DNA invertase Pin-like site-specific DNA recombinase
MRGIGDLFAQYERALIRSRTKAALAVKCSRGERTGTVPLGYRLAADGVHLETHDAEQAAIEAVRRLRQQELSIRAIASRLNEQGIASRGSRWHATSVARLLEREAA